MKSTYEDGCYQAATEVNAFSPEIVVVEEADSLFGFGARQSYTAKTTLNWHLLKKIEI